MAKKSKSKKKTREPLEFEHPYEPEEAVEEPKTRYKIVTAYVLDQDEVNRLIEASSAQYVEPPGSEVNTRYQTYTEEECVALVEGHFHPRRSKKKK